MEYILFKRVLGRFAEDSKYLPISFSNPIKTNLSFLLNADLESTVKDVDFIEFLVNNIFIKQENSHKHKAIYKMHSLILYIDFIFDYHIKYIDEIIECSKTTNKSLTERDNSAYWLTNWHPEKVINKHDFEEGIRVSKKLWQEYTKDIRDALIDGAGFRPLSRSGDYWVTLSGY